MNQHDTTLGFARKRGVDVKNQPRFIACGEVACSWQVGEVDIPKRVVDAGHRREVTRASKGERKDQRTCQSGYEKQTDAAK
jgi:hypothetical protein